MAFSFTLLKAHFAGEITGSGAQLIGFWSQSFLFLTVGSWMSYFTSWGIIFLMCEVEIAFPRVVRKNELDCFIGILIRIK